MVGSRCSSPGGHQGRGLRAAFVSSANTHRLHLSRQPRDRPGDRRAPGRRRANIALIAKTDRPHSRVPGTFHNLAPLSELTVKQFDLLHHVNARGTFVATKACLRYLLGSDHAAVLGLSPPLAADPVGWPGTPPTRFRSRARRGSLSAWLPVTRRWRPTACGRGRRSGRQPSGMSSGPRSLSLTRARPGSLPTPPTRSCAGTLASSQATR